MNICKHVETKAHPMTGFDEYISIYHNEFVGNVTLFCRKPFFGFGMVVQAPHGKTYYPSGLLTKHNFVCGDPLETVLSAADEYGVKFFINNDYWSDWRQVEKTMNDEGIN